MKKLIYFILLGLILSCTSRPTRTSWEITGVDGVKDTIEARNYWILSKDTQFIKFEIDDTIQIIYNRNGITSFRRLY